MTPNDSNGHLPAHEQPFRVLIISGSDRRQYNCPGVDSKSRTLMYRMARRMPEAYAPLVWQCRYGGLEVPDDLWTYCEFGNDRKYSDNQSEHMVKEPDVMASFDAWTDRLIRFVAAKGRVTPAKYRAFGYEPPGHLTKDLKLAWREARMRTGFPKAGSSPAEQQRLELNRNQTLNPRKGEGEKLRETGGSGILKE